MAEAAARILFVIFVFISDTFYLRVGELLEVLRDDELPVDELLEGLLDEALLDEALLDELLEEELRDAELLALELLLETDEDEPDARFVDFVPEGVTVLILVFCVPDVLTRLLTVVWPLVDAASL